MQESCSFSACSKNACLHIYMRTFSRSLKCSSMVTLYISMSSRITTTPLFSKSMNRLFMVHMYVAGTFTRPIDTITHLYILYWDRNMVFGTSSLAMQQCQYPLQRSSDIKNFALPSWSSLCVMAGNMNL